MEWTISRDRWQLHLKSKGAYYTDWAASLAAVQATEPENGAGFAALALSAMQVILERCRLDRLTRSQHMLFRLGELIAKAEAAAVFSSRVVQQPSESLLLDQATRQALARTYARQAAFDVATQGLRWAFAAGQTDPTLAESLNLPAIYNAQAGLLADMDCAVQGLNTYFSS
jgi:hypothetical protein